MLARDPATRVLSVSRKSDAAILPIGRAKAAVYWFESGNFTTSRYYADTLPSWVQAFYAQERRRARRSDVGTPAARFGIPGARQRAV
jgi:hypothetical protein